MSTPKAPQPKSDVFTLPTDVQERIRAEEVFRKSLEPKKGFWQATFAFFNSPFFHTAIVGVVIIFVGRWIKQSDEDKAKKDKIKDLCIEIEYRIRQYEQEQSSPDFQSQISTLNGKFVETVFPKHTGRSFVSLLWELQSLIDKKREKDQNKSIAEVVDEWPGLTKENGIKKAKDERMKKTTRLKAIIQRVKELTQSIHSRYE